MPTNKILFPWKYTLTSEHATWQHTLFSRYPRCNDHPVRPPCSDGTFEHTCWNRKFWDETYQFFFCQHAPHPSLQHAHATSLITIHSDSEGLTRDCTKEKLGWSGSSWIRLPVWYNGWGCFQKWKLTNVKVEQRHTVATSRLEGLNIIRSSSWFLFCLRATSEWCLRRTWRRATTTAKPLSSGWTSPAEVSLGLWLLT